MIQALKDLISLFLYLFVRLSRRNRKAILVYHSIDEVGYGRDPYKMNVSPDLFEQQMRYISKRKEYYTLTFDDGYENVYSVAFPLLKKYRIKSIVFLTIDFINSKMTFNRFFSEGHVARPLSWPQIKEMNDGGVEIGSHGLAHLNMGRIDKELALREALDSKLVIRKMIGQDASAFSYPFGNLRSFNEETTGILKKAGYAKAYTNIMGMDNSSVEPLAIRRIRIYGTDNMFRFKMKIAGAYNWVDSLAPIFTSGCKDD